MENIDLALGALWYFVFIYSTVCHEAAHAWAALKMGDDTAHRGGQVSLDPIPHMRREPVGMILVPIITFLMNAARGSTWMMGWASAPYDPRWALEYPRRAALMAMAGPAANLLLVLLAAVLIRVGIAYDFLNAAPRLGMTNVCIGTESGGKFAEFAALLLSVTFSLNLLLCIFNLMPVPPLDGSCIPLFFLRGRQAEAYQRMLWTPAVQMIGLIVIWNGLGAWFGRAFVFAVNLLYHGHAQY